MTGIFLRRFLAIAAAVMVLSASSCKGERDEGSQRGEEDVTFSFDLSGENGCEAAGSLELKNFLQESGIAVEQEEFSDSMTFCTLSVVWRNVGTEDEFRTAVFFGIRSYETMAEAESAIENPMQINLTPIEDRPSVLLQSDFPGPWEEGYVWSSPDTDAAGRAEAAVRISNVVAHIQFTLYPVNEESSEECRGNPCVMPSDLVAWLHDEYLPKVGANVVALME